MESGAITQSDNRRSRSAGSDEGLLPREACPQPAGGEEPRCSGGPGSSSGGHERRGCGGSHGRLRVEPAREPSARAACGTSGAVRLAAVRVPQECCAEAGRGEGDQV